MKLFDRAAVSVFAPIAALAMFGVSPLLAGDTSRLTYSDGGQSVTQTVSPDDPLVVQGDSNVDDVQATIAAGTLLQRSRIRLAATAEGTGELLSWRGVTLSVSYKDGGWTMYALSSDGKSWVDTDFYLDASEEGTWLNIDIVRMSGKFDGYYVAFVNGSMVTSLMKCGSYDASNNSVSYGKLDFADMEISDVDNYKVYPDYVVRALRRLALDQGSIQKLLGSDGKTVDAVSHRKEVLSDSTRMKLRNLPDVMVDVAPGDLSYSETQWFLTQTVNREYYDYTDAFDITRAPLDACKLNLQGADYLPTIEGRSWTGDVSYANWGENFIEKIYGYIVTDEPGAYTFYVSGDDQAAFYLSDDSDAADLAMAAYTTQPTGRRVWNRYPTQQSGAVTLEANKAYYFELWHVQTTGNASVALAWTTPNSVRNGTPTVIPSQYISSYAGGIPGSSNRDICPPDPSLIGAPPAQDDTKDAVAATFLSLATNGTLMGATPILAADFTTNQYPFHAYEGTGLGWTWSSTTEYPIIYSYTYGYTYYSTTSANPQWFYNYTNGLYMKFYTTPSASMNYLVSVQPFATDFTSGFDSYWSNDTSGDTNNWFTYQGKTATVGSGPSGDDTTGTGYYAYFNTSTGNANTSGNTAILLGPAIIPGINGSIVTFYYHMYGANIGTLELDEKVTSTWTALWSISGQQQTSSSTGWNEVDLYIPPANGVPPTYGVPLSLRLKATAVGGSLGEIAVDDLSVCDYGADSDGDGILDSFECRAHTALRTANALDSDSDGLPVWLEASLKNAGFTTSGAISDSVKLTSIETVDSTSGTVKLCPGQPL